MTVQQKEVFPLGRPSDRHNYTERPYEILCRGEEMSVTHVMRAAGLVASTSEGLRLIDQGAVRIDGERVSDRALQLPRESRVVVEVGKRRVARINLT